MSCAPAVKEPSLELKSEWGWLCELELTFDETVRYPLPNNGAPRICKANQSFILRVCKASNGELHFSDPQYPNHFLPVKSFLPMQSLVHRKLHRGCKTLTSERSRPVLKHWSTKVWHLLRQSVENNPWNYPSEQLEAIPTRGRFTQIIRDEIEDLISNPRECRIFHYGDENPSIANRNNPSVLVEARIHHREYQILLALHAPGARSYSLYRVINDARISPIDELLIQHSSDFETMQLFNRI